MKRPRQHPRTPGDRRKGAEKGAADSPLRETRGRKRSLSARRTPEGDENSPIEEVSAMTKTPKRRMRSIPAEVEGRTEGRNEEVPIPSRPQLRKRSVATYAEVDEEDLPGADVEEELGEEDGGEGENPMESSTFLFDGEDESDEQPLEHTLEWDDEKWEGASPSKPPAALATTVSSARKADHHAHSQSLRPPSARRPSHVGRKGSVSAAAAETEESQLERMRQKWAEIDRYELDVSHY
jgi:hypothetical protein